MFRKIRHIILVVLLLSGGLKAAAQIAMPDYVCVGQTKTYSVNDPSVPSTYKWWINGVVQTDSIKNSISIAWTTPGTYLLQVLEYGSAGCVGDTMSGYVYVSAGVHTDTTATACTSFTWN